MPVHVSHFPVHGVQRITAKPVISGGTVWVAINLGEDHAGMDVEIDAFLTGPHCEAYARALAEAINNVVPVPVSVPQAAE